MHLWSTGKLAGAGQFILDSAGMAGLSLYGCSSACAHRDHGVLIQAKGQVLM